jgi:hypothetical protein
LAGVIFEDLQVPRKKGFIARIGEKAIEPLELAVLLEPALFP